jgi:hypothetical protein
MCRLSILVTDISHTPSTKAKQFHKQIDPYRFLFKYRLLGSNFSFRPGQSPLNSHYAFAKDLKSMQRLVSYHLKEVKMQMIYSTGKGNINLNGET